MQTPTKTVSDITPNQKQQECIDTLKGPVMVLAGPGTGKTTIIIKRIEHMIKQSINPERILALTFSEAAASEMKLRLLNQAGTRASSVIIHTYHAFCSDIISQNALKFELLEDFNIIDKLNQTRLMREVVDEYRPKYLVTKHNDPYFYVNYLVNAVHEIKLNRINREKYLNILETDPAWKPELRRLEQVKTEQEELNRAGKRNRLKTTIKEIETLDSQIKKACEIWDIHEKYLKKMNQYSFIDFDDMINLVLDNFEEDPAFLEEVKSQFDYILVDEYQDTNHSQNELIFNLASDEPSANVFVVGDDDQIIYAFQGAQVDNLERFLRHYPEAKVICLDENNRSTQVILDFAHRIISQDTTRLESNPEFEQYKISKKLVAKNPSLLKRDDKVEMHTFIDIIQENNYIADRIQSIIENNPGIERSEIAILARTNSELEAFADLLKARNIPYQISRQKDIFSLKPSLLVYLYLKALENHQENAMGLFGLVAHPPFNFAAGDYTFLIQENLKTRNDFISLIKKHLKSQKWQSAETIQGFIDTFDQLKNLINNETLSNLIIHLVNQTGILNYYARQKKDRFENILSLKKLVDETRTFEKITHPATLTMLLSYLDSSLKEDINLQIDENNFIENAVQLITLHKSKGREFKYVFLVNLNAKNWEKKPTRSILRVPTTRVEFTKEAEVARILFVGCSRAKERLFLTYSSTSNGKNTELSLFIQNAIKEESLIEKKNHELSTEEYVDSVISQFSRSYVYYESRFLEDLKLRAEKHVMSPSSLYLYNCCPKQFLYQYIYRIPQLEVISPALSFGSAVHKALEKFIRSAMKSGKFDSKDALVKYFKQAMEKALFPSVQERDIRMMNGIKLLDAYYKRLLETPINNIDGIEVNISFIPVDKYLIKGFIDRIDTYNRGQYTVIDYKTGNPKSERQILNEDGTHYHYFDQLCFYKLLYELKNKDKEVVEGQVIFLEEPSKSIRVGLSEDDRTRITEKIVSTFEKIQALEFSGIDGEKQQKEPCKKCVYKLLCKMNAL
jgi:DNA helicase-2/ATP-dependent DNA helicase PcrA